VQQRRQLAILQAWKAGHSSLACVNQICNFVVRHPVVDPKQRRKGRQDAFALFAVTNRAMLRIRFRTGFSTGRGARPVRLFVLPGRADWLLNVSDYQKTNCGSYRDK
jgi:hypothetical protein